MWLNRYKIRNCVLVLIFMCVLKIILTQIFPLIGPLFCTDIKHALYDAKAYNNFWEASGRDANVNSKQLWKNQLLPRSQAEIQKSLGKVYKLLQPFVTQIEAARRDALLKGKLDDRWTRRKVHIVTASQGDYFKKLEYSKKINTVKLAASLSELQDTFRIRFHNQTSNDCDFFRNRSRNTYNVYGDSRKCVHNPQQDLIGQELALDILRPGLPKDHVIGNKSILLSYLHVIKGAIASSHGDVYTEDLRIVPLRCLLDKVAQQDIALEKIYKKLYFSEVFTVSTVWGQGFYHWFVECLPRLVPYVEFLRKNPHIKIHVTQINPFVRDTLQRLGLQQNDLITGHIYAEVMYMPIGVSCGTASWFPTQLQSLLFRDSMVWEPEPRRSIVLIKRTARRYFYCHDYIWNMLNKYGKQYNVRVELFPDKPLPDMETTMKIFNRAMMVVAPHGAGLSNLIYSERNTIVIEGLKCGTNDFPTLCYSDLSYVLGHRYVGLMYKNKPCNWIEAANIEPAVKFYLKTIFE